MNTKKRTKLAILTVIAAGCAVYPNDFHREYSLKGIVDQAMSCERGSHGGQCKAWVQQVNWSVGGAVGTGYRSCFLEELKRTGGTEVFDRDDVIPGCIGQLSSDNDPSDDSYVHTFIVLRNNGDGTFQVIHSNYHGDERVSIDTWNPYLEAAKHHGYSVHFYNFGTRAIRDYNFTSTSSCGWRTGRDLVEEPSIEKASWMVTVAPGARDPGVDSPELGGSDVFASRTVLMLSVAVKSPAMPHKEGGVVYLKDEQGSWNNPAKLVLINTSEKPNVYDGKFKAYDYNLYAADFSMTLQGRKVRDDLVIRQLSVQLTDGRYEGERWLLDWACLVERETQPLKVEYAGSWTEFDVGRVRIAASPTPCLGGNTSGTTAGSGSFSLLGRKQGRRSPTVHSSAPGLLVKRSGRESQRLLYFWNTHSND